MTRLIAWGLAICIGVPASAAPRPKPPSERYQLSILGFNDGTPYRVNGARAHAILADKTAVLFRFRSKDPMGKDTRGTWISVESLAKRFTKRPASDLISVYSVDLDRDGTHEVLLVPQNAAIADNRRYAPTILRQTPKGYAVMKAFRDLRGERYKVLDIRDLNQDGGQELLIAGEVGSKGVYVFRQLIGAHPSGFGVLQVRHVDSIHYVDLNRDQRVEIVVRERVGRRGAPYLWTFIDHLYRWDGSAFVDAISQFPRYHDEQTLPSLVGTLIDHYDAKLAILMEKIDAIKRVRANTLIGLKRPKGYDKRVIKAIALLQKGRRVKARRRLEDLDALYPYDTAVILALASLDARQGRWSQVLAKATRTLTIHPQHREAWWRAAMALTRLQERTSAVACLSNLVRICGKRADGLAFLKARRGERVVTSNPSLRANVERALTRLKSI